MDRAILGFYQEQLLAFHAGYLRPVDRRRAIDVIKVDLQYATFKTFDFAAHAVPVLHDQHVSLVPRKKRRGSKHDKATQSQHAAIHDTASVRRFDYHAFWSL